MLLGAICATEFLTAGSVEEFIAIVFYVIAFIGAVIAIVAIKQDK